MLGKKLGMAAIALTLAGSVSACAGPKYVVDITGADAQVKFVYTQETNKIFWTSNETGLVRCTVNEKGRLDKCSDVPIEFND